MARFSLSALDAQLARRPWAGALAGVIALVALAFVMLAEAARAERAAAAVRRSSEVQLALASLRAEIDAPGSTSGDAAALLATLRRFSAGAPARLALLDEIEAAPPGRPAAARVALDALADAERRLALDRSLADARAAGRARLAMLALAALAGLSLLLSAAGAAAAQRRAAALAAEQRENAKLAAIGQLASGVAHDFNNMLAIVAGALDLARRRLAAGEADIDRYLANAREGADRAGALARRLLAIARRQPLAPAALDAGALAGELSALLDRALGERIELETVFADGLWPCKADASEFENAVLNLAVNARDAMPEGGKLRIETANARVGGADYVMIAVSDTGAGMAPDVAARALEPFFTTKGAGKGTGLGLAQVKSFAEQAGGCVKLDSEPGRGTSVKLYLPRLTDASPLEGRGQGAG